MQLRNSESLVKKAGNKNLWVEQVGSFILIKVASITIKSTIGLYHYGSLGIFRKISKSKIERKKQQYKKAIIQFLRGVVCQSPCSAICKQ